MRAMVLAAVLLLCGCGGSAAAPSPAPAITGGWHLSALHLDPLRAWARGAGEVIAIVDTGFDDAASPALAARIAGRWDAVTGAASAADDNGHGTEMTAIAAGSGDHGVWGAAPDASVLAVKVADARGQADPHSVALGIAWAVGHGATVINLSLAGDIPSEEVSAGIRAARGAGIAVVAAAGNRGAAGPAFPASEPGVVATFGQDRAGHVAESSNVPAGTAVLAPSVDIDTISITSGDPHRSRMFGTSAAAAIVAGIIADCRSTLPAGERSSPSAGERCASRLLRPPGAAGFLDVRQVLEPA